MNLFEKHEKVKDFRPIDDVFFEVPAQKQEVKNSKFPELSAEVTRLKETEGGTQAVCEIMERYENIAIKNERLESIQRLLKLDCSKEFILKAGYTEEEFTEADAQFLQLA